MNKKWLIQELNALISDDIANLIELVKEVVEGLEDKE